MSTIRVEIEQGKSGLFFGTSPDLKGLLIAERSVEGVRSEAPGLIAALRRAVGLPESKDEIVFATLPGVAHAP